MSERLDAFVVCTPGLEPLVATEIEKLGIRSPRLRHGGVDCAVTLAQLWSLNLRLRVATRVLVRVARFPAEAFGTLQAGFRRIDWAQYLAPGSVLDLKVSSANSTLFHTDAIAERIADVLDSAGYSVGQEDAQVVHVRVMKDVVLVSIDASGDALYRRGWRLETAKAPLRETLAAALLAHSGWDRKAPLIDPFCGSGTIVIEAALTARRVAAGLQRPFAFQNWPSFDEAAWTRMRKGAEADIVASKALIMASDRDEGAIAAAKANAERAGVADAISFRTCSISDVVMPERAGWIVTNPPYGERVGGGDLRDLYAAFGKLLRAGGPGCQAALVAPENAPHGLDVSATLNTTNGGIPVSLIRGTARVS